MSKAATASSTALPATRTPARRYWLEILNNHVNRIIPKGASAMVEEVGRLRKDDYPRLDGKLLHCEISHLSGQSNGYVEKVLLRANLKQDGKLHLTFESKLAHYRGSEEIYPSDDPDTVVHIKGRVIGLYEPVGLDGSAHRPRNKARKPSKSKRRA